MRAHNAPGKDTTAQAVVGALLEATHDTNGAVRADAPLAPLTTLKVGGNAAALVTAEHPDDLVAVAEICAATARPWLILGRGSNLLVSDTGWRGVAVALGTAFRGVQIHSELVEAGGAEAMPSLAHTVARHGLGGLAFGVAIPGTVGGAVRMNAGAHGRDTSEVLRWADVVRLSRGGRIERWSRDDLGMGYRHTEVPADAVVVRAGFALQRASDERLAADMREMQRWRRAHQPLGERSCGSVFRNPAGDSAGRLIDSAGLKGHRVGGATVSDKHANFITVDGSGTAADVHTLILLVQEQVRAVHGVELIPEVVMVGFDDDRATGQRADSGAANGARA